MARFSDVPAELRNILYAELFPKRECRKLEVNGLAPFTVSKQLHDESTSYFYQHSHIAIDAPSKTASDAATILPPIADKYLRFLRHLTLYTSTGHAATPSVRKTANAIASLSAIGARFDEVTIWIKSPLSHLLNSRVDDSIMGMDHPITVALRHLIATEVAKITRIILDNAWFAPGVTRTLHTTPGSRLKLYMSDTLPQELPTPERSLTGRYSSTHFTALGLDHGEMDECSATTTSAPSSPSSVPRSLCSAFTDLDTFSVTSFEMSSEEEAEKEELGGSSDEGEQPFFTDDDIEEWQASTQEPYQKHIDNFQDEDIDVDEEMEEVPDDDVQALFDNLEDTAHHIANEADVTYLTNFAPDLLLSRHHLVHLG